MLFPIAIERGDDEHAYGVAVPDLPGCFSAGDTFEEALANVREAIEGWLEVAVEHGDPIPQAQTVESHIDNPDYAGWIWAVVDIDVTPYLGKSHKINVTLPDLLVKQIDDFVDHNPGDKTRSGFLARVAMQELARARKT
ncbi:MULTISPECIES: type II toxin-antitoxin system HicB family antitoxin [unclassified Modicisalibacter]|uniref:type II toxin-antitoxin system HicB family antitoxin n=1 Tax=unclassified Modicisalibacter TaxID=2679913 RepID=UPI001CCFD0F1|nr:MULTISPECIES: type II toxin-antitoxin system HicB family antitoxin [unclassified Modicisalibacter]MBZ9557290.1 type II toxin-antitoxin system HicB family antitoxin [Modicisalibacter sp. R2A 31.J]MBZ9573996.1 type II toxin-antitoxin system HicB family antitoxin [Modicisalibacter sp. MOD 31.J]